MNTFLSVYFMIGTIMSVLYVTVHTFISLHPNKEVRDTIKNIDLVTMLFTFLASLFIWPIVLGIFIGVYFRNRDNAK